MAKKKMIAVHVVELTKETGKHKTATTAAKKPVVDRIEPGTAFMVEEAEAKKLEARGAAKFASDVSKEETAAAEKKAKAAKTDSGDDLV